MIGRTLEPLGSRFGLKCSHADVQIQVDHDSVYTHTVTHWMGIATLPAEFQVIHRTCEDRREPSLEVTWVCSCTAQVFGLLVLG